MYELVFSFIDDELFLSGVIFYGMVFYFVWCCGDIVFCLYFYGGIIVCV